PDYIKIDRFFIENINEDSRKKFFVSNIVNLAHMMGIAVIAEGIETTGEFYVCREIGCDYAQGYLVQRPEADMDKLLLHYPIVEELVNKDKRKSEGDKNLIKREIINIPSVLSSITIAELLRKFREVKDVQCFPVINESNEPLGILRESDLKKYVYSPYGISILQHKSSTDGIDSLIHKTPIMEIYNPIEKILELYSLSDDLDYVIITENGHYKGVLGSSSILRILSEKKISIARDSNPLTGLPGNSSINSYLSTVLKHADLPHVLAYFDFDNFKPFNDKYGFRQGDRIIRLFAELLQQQRPIRKNFIGHIGGDDFFIGYAIDSYSFEDIIDEITVLIENFANDVIPFYKKEHREQGFIVSKSRTGQTMRFPLMTVSAAVVYIDRCKSDYTIESLTEKIALTKHKAKISDNHIAILEE
ncbi:MAG: GGDEF domain-containing protein, partial [Spirochaetales bacterium]|nr:GGDEF domain-containing protein [Spirochaetales bacterium]